VLPDPEIAFPLDGRASLSGNDSRHAASVRQMRISCINDSIRIIRGDIALHELEHVTGRK
jgi:hypothetical protein